MNKFQLVLLGLVIVLASGCKKYYYDSGVHDPVFDGTTLEYLNAKTPYFDSTVMVAKLAGLDQVLQNETVTFFAPPSGSVNRSIIRLNAYLRFNGKDTVSKLEQIKPEVWRAVLAQYIFKGKSLLKDYPQKDTVAYVTFPGQNYSSYDGRVMNIGVVYNDAGGVQYAGYRQLFLSYIPDLSNPQIGLQNNPISSSNIETSNGAVHVLNRGKHNLGFVMDKFIDQAVSAGIDPATP
ncbi:fasciclin domain-containing protein [Sphingobacterium multivorum]|uniref:fasciclin domain-containing protein n=1 Tax=Sphingobacterium multivorum TaxID=28454 RepID=UPI002FD93552